jgi:translation initiation factor RLI1
MGQGSKWVNVDFEQCQPAICDPETGACPAAIACTHKILIQEDPGEEPMLISMKLCVGCADCVRVCPLNALTISQGF